MKKKKLSMLLALIMSVSVLATACGNSEKEETVSSVTTAGQEETVLETSAQAEDTTTEAETAEAKETEAETAEDAGETEAETTTAQAAEETTTAAQTDKATETSSFESIKDEAAKLQKTTWTETNVNQTMTVNTSCYSRKGAYSGASKAVSYKKGTTVTVVALTSTSYYKLDDGTYIYSKYLTLDSTSQTTTTGTTTSTGVKLSFKYDYTKRYAYNKLSDKKKALYKQFYDAALNLNGVVEPKYSYTKEEIIEVYTLVLNQEPELFWLSTAAPTGTKYIFITFLEQDPAQIAKMQKAIDANVKTIMAQANKAKSTAEKLKVFYDWIVYNADFELKSGYNTTIYNGLGVKGGKIQCSGYAKSMQYLCDYAGIESMVIVGTNKKSESHAWNVVKVDGSWYNLDTTWADPICNYGSSYIRYEFFLVPDAWIHNISHFNVNKKIDGTKVTYFTPPACTATKYNYFKIYKKEFSTEAAAEKELYAQFDAAVKNGTNVVEIRVTSKELYDKLLSKSKAKTYNAYAKGLSTKVKGISKQTDGDGVWVVHYDIVYK